MRKSIPGSSINVDMNIDQIRHKLQHEEGYYSKPDDSVAYQIMNPMDMFIVKNGRGGKL